MSRFSVTEAVVVPESPSVTVASVAVKTGTAPSSLVMVIEALWRASDTPGVWLLRTSCRSWSGSGTVSPLIVTSTVSL